MENEKNMNNSILGKAMENLRNRVDICLVIDAIKYQNVVYKPFLFYIKYLAKIELQCVKLKKFQQS